MNITILDKQNINSAITMAEAIQADKDALAIYSKGGADIPLRANLNVPEQSGSTLFMYGNVPAADALGVKIVSVFPKNVEKGLPSVPATMIMVDNTTGQVCAILDGTHLTRLRTGAVAGAATDLLSRKDSRVFALFGAGGQAESQLEAVLTVRDIELVKVCCRNYDHADAFAKAMTEKFAGRFPARITAVHTSEEAVADADIITAVTTTKTPVFDGRLVKPGAHINGVGSFTPDMAEIDAYTLTHADLVYVDTMDGVMGEAGDFLQPIARGEYDVSRITGELGAAINGDIPVRTSDSQITFFKSVGSAVLDLVTARRVYENAIKKGQGMVIEL